MSIKVNRKSVAKLLKSHNDDLKLSAQSKNKIFAGRGININKSTKKIPQKSNADFFANKKNTVLLDRDVIYKDLVDINIIKSLVSNKVKKLSLLSNNTLNKQHVVEIFKSVFKHGNFSVNQIKELREYFINELKNSPNLTQTEQNYYSYEVEVCISRYIEEKARYLLSQSVIDEEHDTLSQILDILEARKFCSIGNNFYGDYLLNEMYNLFITGIKEGFSATKNIDTRSKKLQQYKLIGDRLKQSIKESKIIFNTKQGKIVGSDITSNHTKDAYIKDINCFIYYFSIIHAKATKEIGDIGEIIIELTTKHNKVLNDYEDKLKKFNDLYKGKPPLNRKILFYIKDTIVLSIKKRAYNSYASLLEMCNSTLQAANFHESSKQEDLITDDNSELKSLDITDKEYDEKLQLLATSLVIDKEEDIAQNGFTSIKNAEKYFDLLFENSLLNSATISGNDCLIDILEQIDLEKYKNKKQLIIEITEKYFTTIAKMIDIQDEDAFIEQITKGLEYAIPDNFQYVLQTNINNYSKSNLSEKTDEYVNNEELEFIENNNDLDWDFSFTGLNDPLIAYQDIFEIYDFEDYYFENYDFKDNSRLNKNNPDPDTNAVADPKTDNNLAIKSPTETLVTKNDNKKTD